MRRLATTAFGMLALTTASSVGAEMIPDGSYKQQFSDYGSGQCGNCIIYVKQKTPNTIEILGSNGWIGSAYYDSNTDMYLGFFEWRKNSGMPYVEGVLHKITLRYESQSKMISLEGDRPNLNFRIIYTK